MNIETSYIFQHLQPIGIHILHISIKSNKCSRRPNNQRKEKQKKSSTHKEH